MTEVAGLITFSGGPLTLLGSIPKVGDVAPEFTAVTKDLGAFKLSDLAGTVRIISAVPSIDTHVCNLQTRRFNVEASKIGAKILTISMDLPFAQQRWCAAEGVNNLTMLSDHREASFGLKYGLLIKELKLLARTIFVVGKDNKIHYVQLVKEVTHEPNYEEAIAAAQKLL